MRKAGLDPDTVLLKTAQLVEQRDVSRWLPLALAGIYNLVSAYGTKNPPSVADTLRSWGLFIDAASYEELARRANEDTTDKALAAFFRKG